jgi:hypothetical protein
VLGERRSNLDIEPLHSDYREFSTSLAESRCCGLGILCRARDHDIALPGRTTIDYLQSVLLREYQSK